MLFIGDQYVVHPAGGNNELLLARFRFPTARFVLWRAGVIALPVVIPAQTGAALFGQVNALATYLNCGDAAARGFTAASTIVNGLLYNEQTNAPVPPIEPQFANRYFTAGLETGIVLLPAPQGSNFLWRILGLGAVHPDNDFFGEEWRSLSGMTANQGRHVGAATAVIYSLGVSAVLHSMNITGRELNHWQAQHDNPVKCILNGMMATEMRNEGNLLALFSCELSGMVTDMWISPDCFRAPRWSGGEHNLPCNGLFSLWGGAWPIAIPYVINPLHITWALTSWLDLWGILL